MLTRWTSRASAGGTRLLFALVGLVFTLGVGCGGSSDGRDSGAAGDGSSGDHRSGEGSRSTGPVTIRYFRWADPSELDATRAALDAFEAVNPHIDVKLEYTNFGGYSSKLQTLIAGREAPDVFALSGAWLHDLRARGVLEDLGPFVDTDPSVDLLDFYRAPVEVFQLGDALYGLPRDFNVVALFYNTALFDAAGVAHPDSTWGWDELRGAARALTRDLDGDGHPDQWGLQVSNDMEVSWGNYVYQNGGRILTEDRRRFALHEPPAIEALDFLAGLIYEDRVSPSPLDMESLSGTPFRNGRIAMITSGSWTLGTLDATEGFTYGVAPLPKGRERAAVANGVAHAMSASSAHRDAAWKLIAFLSSPEGQRLLARSGTSIPARRSVAESEDFLGAGRPGVDRSVFLSSMAYARTLPFTPGLARWGGEVIHALDRVWLRERTPKAAMREVQPTVDGILARERGRASDDETSAP